VRCNGFPGEEEATEAIIAAVTWLAATGGNMVTAVGNEGAKTAKAGALVEAAAAMAERSWFDVFDVFDVSEAGVKTAKAGALVEAAMAERSWVPAAGCPSAARANRWRRQVANVPVIRFFQKKCINNSFIYFLKKGVCVLR
jgi:hypothetical protein